MILSILIPTIPERAEMFTNLYNELFSQISLIRTIQAELPEVEILVDGSPKFLEGGMSIGKKRESLVSRAQGDYLCFLDDDETVSPNYVESLIRLCLQDKDVCTFVNITKLESYWMVVDMSLNNPSNEEARPGIIKRRPWHVCPVRSKYAKLYNFEDINYGEDWRWFEKVLHQCETEAHTDAVLMQYNHGSHSEADKITQHGI